MNRWQLCLAMVGLTVRSTERSTIRIAMFELNENAIAKYHEKGLRTNIFGQRPLPEIRCDIISEVSTVESQ